MIAAISMAGCLSVGSPPAGKPLVTIAGKTLVFGRVEIHEDAHVVPPVNPGASWASVGPGLRPELTLYLLRLSPRRIARPQFVGQGAFYWSLSPGDYLLLGSPAADVGEPEVSQRHWPLAALRVMPADGAVCAGVLVVEAVSESIALKPVPLMNFSLGRVDVLDRCVALAADLETRYARPASPPAKRLLVAASDLDFSDPALFERVRALLDAAQE
jgi:hypothetical protein